MHNARLVTNDNVQAKPIHTLDGSQLNEKSIYTYVTTTFIRSVFERHWVLVYDTTVRTNIKSTITMNSEICCMPHLSTLKPNGHQWYWHSPENDKELKIAFFNLYKWTKKMTQFMPKFELLCHLPLKWYDYLNIINNEIWPEILFHLNTINWHQILLFILISRIRSLSAFSSRLNRQYINCILQNECNV